MPATVKSIGDQAFYNDSTIAVVTMREGLETIGNEVFWNNSGVRSFVIPGTVQTIGTNSFYGCTNTSTLRFKDGDGILTIDTKKLEVARLTICFLISQVLMIVSDMRIENMTTFMTVRLRHCIWEET